MFAGPCKSATEVSHDDSRGNASRWSYDPLVVALSVVIAVAASYAALDLAGRVTASKRRSFAAWLICGSIAMGIGIWSMHFAGMLATSTPWRPTLGMSTAP